MHYLHFHNCVTNNTLIFIPICSNILSLSFPFLNFLIYSFACLLTQSSFKPLVSPTSLHLITFLGHIYRVRNLPTHYPQLFYSVLLFPYISKGSVPLSLLAFLNSKIPSHIPPVPFSPTHITISYAVILFTSISSLPV